MVTTHYLRGVCTRCCQVRPRLTSSVVKGVGRSRQQCIRAYVFSIICCLCTNKRYFNTFYPLEAKTIFSSFFTPEQTNGRFIYNSYGKRYFKRLLWLATDPSTTSWKTIYRPLHSVTDSVTDRYHLRRKMVFNVRTLLWIKNNHSQFCFSIWMNNGTWISFGEV